MSTLSTFQTLPLHIAEDIADHCIKNYRSVSYRIDLESKSHQAWETFYDVSSLWRVLALRYFCRKLSVCVIPESSGHIKFFGLPRSIKVHKQFYSYAKAVTLSVDGLGSKSYSAIAEGYSKVLPKDITLASANSLLIRATLNPFSRTTVDSHVENEKLFRILQLIRTSMPKLREVQIGRYTNADYWPVHSANTTEPKLDSLFMDILKRAPKIGVRTWPSLLDGRDALLLNGSLITSLSYTVSKGMKFFSIVLQRIGPTLESLEIEKFPLRSIKALVFNRDGSPIVYSQLKRLIFCTATSRWRTTPRIDLIATPFPSLRYLKWVAEYPFENDLIFRGSRDTLEHLDIKFDRAALGALGRPSMSSRGRYTRLRHLSMRIDSDMAGVVNDCNQLLESSVSLISPATGTFATDSRCSREQVLDTFSTCPYTDNLRVLSLRGTNLLLFDIMKLIELLPNMTDIVCYFNGLGTNMRKTKNRTVLDPLYPEYYPLSRRLKVWEITRSSLHVTHSW